MPLWGSSTPENDPAMKAIQQAAEEEEERQRRVREREERERRGEE